MNDLQVKVLEVTPAVVKFNFEQLKTEAEKIASEYKGLVFTAETVKEGKKVVAELRKVKKNINDFKVKTKKELTASVKTFEEQCKDLMATFDEPLEFIDNQMKHFEENRISELLDYIRNQFDELYTLYNVEDRFRKYEVEKSWTNVTKKKGDLAKEMDAIAKTCEFEQKEYYNMIEFIDMSVKVANADHELNVKLSPDAFRRYVGTLPKEEISAIITKTAVSQKEQEEAFAQREREKAKREAQAQIEKVKQEASREVAEVIEAVEEMQAPIEAVEEVKAVTLEIKGDKGQLNALKAWLENNNMEYKRVK